MTMLRIRTVLKRIITFFFFPEKGETSRIRKLTVYRCIILSDSFWAGAAEPLQFCEFGDYLSYLGDIFMS